MARDLKSMGDVGTFGGSRAGRVLQSIRRDMDITEGLMRNRRRNEEVLALAYQDGTMMGGGSEQENLKEYALNLPFRQVRWLISQATSKDLVIKVNRSAGPGQKPGGPGDEETGAWVGETLKRVSYIAGFRDEMEALMTEVHPRGTSVMAVGYHRQVISATESAEAGKDVQTIGREAISGDMEAKEGQAHGQISEGLAAQASDPEVQLEVGRQGVDMLLARKSMHDQAALETEMDESPISSARDIRHRIWMQKLRVGEDCGCAPWVYDLRDTPFWWHRNMWTLAEVYQSDLFSDEFKAQVQGFDARNVSDVMEGGQTPSTQNMGSDAQEAQSEEILDPDERMVEWFAVWYRRPELRSGGIRKIVCAETPDIFCEADDQNPHVNQLGECVIPGFYPFFDFTPLKASLTVPERTRGIAPMSVGMTQFERLRVYNRLRVESAMRHSLRLYDVHPAHKGNKKLLNALRRGDDGYAQIMKEAQVDITTGRYQPSVVPIQFTGNTQEIERQAMREESDWIKVTGMPPAVLQGMGTADTATQDQQGIAAGERESGSIITYFERRMGDVLAAIRGLIRINYDAEDFVELLGEAGAAVMLAWQQGSTDDGDTIEVTFGARAQAQEVVERKQLMEAISLVQGQVDPITGLPLYDTAHLIEELYRSLDVGAPKPNDSVVQQLQQMVMMLAAQLNKLTGGGTEPGQSGSGEGQSRPQSGPNRSEGDGPTQGNLNAGARRGTVPSEPFAGAGLAGAVSAGGFRG